MRAKFTVSGNWSSVKSLDLAPSQYQVANLPKAAVAVVFGSPGSGKTTALKARFLALVESGISPERILVVSATRDAANILRDELALELQSATLGPLAKTLNSFAFELLTAQARALGTAMPQLLSGSEQDQLLREILETHGASIWPKQFDDTVLSLAGFRTELRDLISVALEYDLEPDDLAHSSNQHQLPAWLAAAACYRDYLRILSESGKYDSVSLLRAAAKIIQDPQTALTKDVILVDDAQELTPAAGELIYQLSLRDAGVVLFGDPDVATLGFRVANPKVMSELGERISSEAKKIFLEPTHAIRPPAISAALSRISSQIEVARAGRQRRGLNPPAEMPASSDALQVKVYLSESDEASALASALRHRHLFDSVPWNQMAVVARSRPLLEDLALKLAAESVPVRVVGSANALREEHASGELLRLASSCLSDEPIDEETALSLFGSEQGGLNQLGITKLRRALRKISSEENLSQNLFAELFSDLTPLALIRSPEARACEKLIRLMAKTKELANNRGSTIENVLWLLFDGSGVRERWIEQARGVSEIANAANRNLDSILALFAAAARFTERNPDALAIEFVRDQLEREVPEDTLALNELRSDRVLLLTPSGLIGKRFDTVALTCLTEGVWPNLKPRSSLLGAQILDAIASRSISTPSEFKKSELGDELRMLAKAVGAATQRLFVSATDKEEEQISQFISLLNGSIPAPEKSAPRTHTLRALVGETRRNLSVGAGNRSEQLLALARLAAAGVPGARPDSWYGLSPLTTSDPLVDTESEKVVVRPSQLENYLKCPLHWFLESHGGREDSFSASLGTLIHEVLEASSSAELEHLQRLTDARWNSLEFEADWLAESANRKAGKMLANLASYLESFERDGGSVLAVEQNFAFELGSAQIRGQVDRIEKLKDGSVVVVDLKTTNVAPSDAYTQNHAQLALYQLAIAEGGFKELPEIKPEQLAGARLLVVGTDKPTVRNQPALTPESSAKFRKIILDASEGMSRSVFVASVSSHCEDSREFGSCQLHLIRAVSYVG